MKKVLVLISMMMLVVSSVYAEVRVGLVFDAGGKFDRSFNQSAWEGAEKAQKDLGITLKDVEPGDSSAVEEAMRVYASQNYDLVIGIGFANKPYMEKVAKEFPKVKFAIVDDVLEMPNVSSLVFKEQEGSYLVGMIAAMRSREVNGARKVGFIGGMDIPLIHKFEAGYAAGVKRIYPTAEVIINYVGNTPTAWNDPAKAKEIAISQMGKGASVIYSAAGASGNGMFDAVKDTNGEGPCYPVVKKGMRKDSCVYAIGVDSNQNYILPGQVLTSMLKRVDVAVYTTIKQVVDGKFKAGVNIFGLESNGVGYAVDKYNKRLITRKMKSVIDLFRNKIIKGDIVVPAERQ